MDKQGSTTISLKGYPTNCWIKMEWVSSLYRVCTISICFNHAHVSSRVVPPYTFGIKPPILSLMITFYSILISPLFLRLHHISFKCNVQLWFLPNSGCRNLHLDLGKKVFFWRYPRCLVGYCLSQGADFCTSDFGNTEVVPWDLGKKDIYFADIRVQKFACGLRNQPYLLYSTMIFPAMDSGSFILRFRQKKILPIFWLGGPQIHRHRKSVA